MSNENIQETKISNNEKKIKNKNKLGIILEEKNNNNSDNENSLLFDKEGSNMTFNNSAKNFKSISLINIDKIEKDMKFQTQNFFFKDKFINDKINNDCKYNRQMNKCIEKNNQNLVNKCKAEDIIILNSGKKQSELIKLISTNNTESIGNENYTKNINLNININNNIQYEIEKNKEKEEENNDLNQSLNSLLKIADKNCLYFNDSLKYDINKNKTFDSSSIIMKKNKNNNNYKEQSNNKKTINEKEKLNLPLYKTQVFKKIIKDKISESNVNVNKIEKLKITNQIPNENTFKKNNNIKSKQLIPRGNNLYNRDNIYNKKKSSHKNLIIKKIRNLSFKIKENDEKKNIYQKIKKFSNNELSTKKRKKVIIGKKEENDNINKPNLGIKNKNNIMDYKYSTYKIEDINPIKQKSFNRNTFSEINSMKVLENKAAKNKKYFEVNISLDNYYTNNQYIENSIGDISNKIYKKPSVFKNIIKKVKSLDKLKKEKDLYLSNNNSSRLKKNLTIIKQFSRTKTNNYINEKNEKRSIEAYTKKNPYLPDYYDNTNSNTNQKFYIHKRSRNDIIKYNNPKTINTYNATKSNYKKYEDIYDNSYPKNIFRNPKFTFEKLGDLLILEEKLCDVILALKRNKKADNQSLDFFNYYFNFSMYKQLEKLFENDIDEEVIRLCLNYILITVLLCYKFSKDNDRDNISSLLEILQFCHRNLITIYEQVLKQIEKEKDIKSLWKEKLGQIVNYSKKTSEQIFSSQNFISSLIGKIDFNTNCLIKKLKNILYDKNYQNKNIIINFIKNLNQKTYEEINIFFKDYIYIIDNPEGSILPQVYKPIDPIRHNQNYPYIKTPNKKRYSLILDLNETLISFKYSNNSKGLIRVRPYLYQFLDAISLNYELILFTGSNKNYVYSIIEVLERKKKYFDFIFTRQYLVKFGDCYLKDLSKIGRPLDSTIIIDNNPLNFKLQKENGIYIKSFWGDNNKDTTLYDLIHILNNISKEERDVRDSISKYKDEIVSKISANIS